MSLILFIHGFLGSEDSFGTFPEDLSGKHPHFTCKIYPTFDTRGNITKQVHALSDYLLLEANTCIYSSVILIGHSMGGILALDTFNYLQTLNAVPEMVNIVKVISIDSPFFGLSSDFSKSSVWNITTSFKESVQSVDFLTGISTLSSGITLSTLSSRMTGLMYIGKKVDQVTDHLRFLYPLAEKEVDQVKRFQDTRIFHGFYLRFSKDNSFTYFCKIPPLELQEYFTPLDSKKEDEIQGHMYIFSSTAKEEYETLLMKISSLIEYDIYLNS